MRKMIGKMVATSALLTVAAVAFAQPSAWMPTFAPDGTARVPAFELPPSGFASKEAAEVQKARAAGPARSRTAMSTPDITAARQALESYVAPQLKLMRGLYAADVRERIMGGVRTRWVTPSRGAKIDFDRVLINLHGGALQQLRRRPAGC